jgi:hypothetical protein
MVNSHHTQASRENIIATQQSSGSPVDLRRKLNNQVYVAMGLIKNGKAMRRSDMIAKGEAMKAEAAEQLHVLNAFDPRIVRLMERVAIRRFREETRRMKAAQS